MDACVFDLTKLNKNEQKIYLGMTDSEKQAYEKTWIQLEKCKQRLIQQKNASQLRTAREQKALAEKERKARAHRLIERGAILESLINNASDFTNEELKALLEKIFSSDLAREEVGHLRRTKGL